MSILKLKQLKLQEVLEEFLIRQVQTGIVPSFLLTDSTTVSPKICNKNMEYECFQTYFKRLTVSKINLHVMINPSPILGAVCFQSS